jgi:Xaa-Pro aminopeptidase
MRRNDDGAARRWARLRRAMASEKLEALLVTPLPDVRWLCGFTGSNAALAVTARQAVLFTDGRYTAQARQETRGARVVIAKHSALKEACALLGERVKHAAFDPAQTTVADLELMRTALQGKVRRGFFEPLKSPMVSDLRMVKDAAELAAMERAARLGCRLFEEIVPRLQAGIAEIALAAELEYRARSLGAEGMSFETIVAAAWPRHDGTAASQRLRDTGLRCYPQGLLLRYDAHRAYGTGKG